MPEFLILEIKNQKILSRLGYRQDQQGILNRFFREEASWEAHLENSKRFIEKSATSKQKKIVCVLGSGWLLDVPIDFLLENFQQIYLVDIVHPKQILHKYRKNSQIFFLQQDITGGIAEFAEQLVRQHKKGKAKTAPEAFTNFQFNFQNKLPASPDFIISLNLLNQLDILIVDYLKKYDLYTHDELIQIRRHIQQAHLNIMPKQKSCLIADYEELIFSDKEKISRKKSIYVDFPKANFSKKWLWKFDTTMTYRANFQTHFQVLAIDF